MPLGLEPNKTFKVVLKSDMDKPIEKRPWFEFLYLSMREYRRKIDETKTKLIEEAQKGGRSEKGIVIELLRAGLVGWGNMLDPVTSQAIPFNFDELDRIVTISEANELLDRFKEQGYDFEERKN